MSENYETSTVVKATTKKKKNTTEPMPCRTRNNCIYYIALHHIKSRGKSLNMLSKRRGIASNNKKNKKKKRLTSKSPASCSFTIAPGIP